jgi:predicted TIM-barrel fold metal-dependent hydrolase
VGDRSTGGARIDLHAHFIPDIYREAAVAAGHEHPDGMPEIPTWSPELALEVMDRLDIQAACVSVSSPGVYFDDADKAVRLARRVNEEGAALVADHPRRFGFFASLPLPDVDAALAELAFSLDELNADGVVLLTNSSGTYLGDPKLDPLWRELGRRGATVFVHPTAPSCQPVTATRRPEPIMEFLFDTTRAVTDLILSGALVRNPDVRVIVPHAGAALPAMAHRIAAISQRLQSHEPGSSDVLGSLRSLWYDTAGFPMPAQLPALLHIAQLDHLVWGSDWPFTLEAMVARASAALDAAGFLSPDQLGQIHHGNAAALVPSLFARATEASLKPESQEALHR